MKVLADGTKTKAWMEALKRAECVVITYSRPLHAWFAKSEGADRTWVVTLYNHAGAGNKRVSLSCSCPGYEHAQLCKHVAAVAKRISRWREVDLRPLNLTPLCGKCGMFHNPVKACWKLTEVS